MLTWEQFEDAAPEMARFGVQRISERVMYIGTVRRDGYPRLHPFTPFLSSGHLFAFMYKTSPKGHDLKRDGRYVIHSLVKDMNGTDGEFMVTGKATFVEDPETRATALKGCPYDASTGEYDCFEFLVGECMTNHYVGGNPQVVKWKDPASSKS